MKLHSFRIRTLVLIGVLFLSVAFVYAETAEEYSHRGNTYLKQNNFTQAISDYTKAIKINPNLAEAYNNRGNAYLKQNNFTQAISDYIEAIKINPNLADAYYHRGLAYVNQNNFTQAISDCTKAIKINPNLAEAYFYRGLVYNTAKEYDNAWIDVYKAKELGYTVNPEFLNGLKKASKGYKQVHLKYFISIGAGLNCSALFLSAQNAPIHRVLYSLVSQRHAHITNFDDEQLRVHNSGYAAKTVH